MDWFRMYSDLRGNRKLDALTDPQFRVFIYLMCYANEQEPRGTIPQIEDAELLAAECARGDTQLLIETVERLKKFRTLTQEDDGSLVFRNWEKRQYESDSSIERVRKHRTKKRNGDVTARNGDVTPSDTDSDTDTETEIYNTPLTPQRGEGYTADFKEFWEHYPRSVNKKGAFKAWKAALKKGVTAEQLSLAARNYAAERKGQDSQFTLHAATFLGPQERWRDYLDKPRGEEHGEEQQPDPLAKYAKFRSGRTTA